jgi:hypothetical protein
MQPPAADRFSSAKVKRLNVVENQPIRNQTISLEDNQ